MKKLIVVIVLSVFVFACGQSEEKKAEDSATGKACATKDLNPNGDSELAVLMREMAKYTEDTKAALLEGKELPAKPASLATIHTAQKTEADLDTSVFNPMATHYLAQVDQFVAAGKEDKVRYFNSMVAACKGCHENFCHGPLKRIEKMIIAETK